MEQQKDAGKKGAKQRVKQRKTIGYRGYQGKKPKKSPMKAVVVLLVLLVLLAVAGLLFVQSYLTYTDDGVRLDVPFFPREQPPAGDVSVPVEIVR